MIRLSDSERISMTSSAVFIQWTSCDGRTDYGIAVAYTRYSIGLLSRVKKTNAINFKKSLPACRAAVWDCSFTAD